MEIFKAAGFVVAVLLWLWLGPLIGDHFGWLKGMSITGPKTPGDELRTMAWFVAWMLVGAGLLFGCTAVYGS